MAKLTFLTIPVELRLKIYKYIPTGPLILGCTSPPNNRDSAEARGMRFFTRPPGMRFFNPPKPRKYLHQPDNQPVSSLGILRVCHQIRDEAIPVLYERVYLDSNSILVSSFRVHRLDDLMISSIKEASMDIPDNTRTLDYWLTHVSAFRNITDCKLFNESHIGSICLRETKAAVLQDELFDFLSGLSSSTSIIPMLKLKVTLTIKLVWSSDPPPEDDAVEGSSTRSDLEHHEVRQSDIPS